MFSFCRNLLIACIIVLSVIFCVGFMLPNGDRMRVTVADERKVLNVTVTLFDITDEYSWVTLYGCTAERSEETMQMYCTYFWERESTQTIRRDQNQYPFVWRQVPGGLLQLTAVAFDRHDKVLASQTLPHHKRY